MDESAEKAESEDAVIIVENEAESMPVLEESAKQQSSVNLLETCAVCSLSFHSREPKLLPCLHSFCKKCLPSPSRSLVMPDQSTSGPIQADNAANPRKTRAHVVPISLRGIVSLSMARRGRCLLVIALFICPTL